MIFVDTSAFIAMFVNSEEKNGRAKEIFAEAYESGETIVTSDHVLDETLTFVNRHFGSASVDIAKDIMLNAQKTEMAFCVPEDVKPTVQMMEKYRQLSFCDALSATMMQKKGIRKIFSFDSDFDKIPGIKRLC